MRKLLLSLVLSSAALTAAAHADTFKTGQTFYFNGTTTSGSIGTGTITTDSNGIANGGQITFAGGGSNAVVNFFGTGVASPSYTEIDFSSSLGVNAYIYLKTSLANVTSESVCAGQACPFYNFFFGRDVYRTSSVSIDNFSGTLSLEAPVSTVTAATPEPSSLVLLGTGALGMAGAVRRRFLTRA